jgi:CRP/FNR family cyclic AMP-dependent transcriptional regulator
MSPRRAHRHPDLSATGDGGMDAREFLADIPLFAEALNAGQLRLLAADSRPALFLAGTYLMNQGEFGGSMFVIVKGEVSVTFAGEGGHDRSVAKLGPGEIVGEMSLFTGDRRTATVSAATNVEALEITKVSLERVFSKSPELVDRFAAVLAKRQGELNAMSAPRNRLPREVFVRRARTAFAALFKAP